MIPGRQTGSDTLIRFTGKEIADDLDRRIRTGEYGPDDRLDYGELTALYVVSKSTIQRAVGLLQDRGLVTYQPGHGWYIRTQGSPEMTSPDG